MRPYALVRLLLVLAIPLTGAAMAQDQEEQETRDQINLIWVAGFQGPLNGRMGPRARDAVGRFQAAQGFPRTGNLVDYQRQDLERLASAEKRRLGWRMRLDAVTGMRIGVADALVEKTTREDNGTEYVGSGGAFRLRTLIVAGETEPDLRTNMEGAFQFLRESGFAATYSTLKDDWYVINATHRTKAIDAYIRMHRADGWIKGYMLFTLQNGPNLGGLVTATSLSMVADAAVPNYVPRQQPSPRAIPPVAEAAPRPVTPAATPAPSPKASGPSMSSGTGFVVGPGRLLTNNHVVEDCAKLEVRTVGPARVLVRDAKNDLALVEASGLVGKPLTFASESVRLGEDVLAMGYPLPSYLADRINITQGIVSSTEGMGGDWTNLQISVPVQPGNSGGPLFDMEGRVHGVVVARMKPILTAGGDVMIPQQVNFAIKTEVARGFLKGNGVTVVEAPSGGKEARKSTADLAEAAKPSVVQLVCTGG